MPTATHAASTRSWQARLLSAGWPNAALAPRDIGAEPLLLVLRAWTFEWFEPLASSSDKAEFGISDAHLPQPPQFPQLPCPVYCSNRTLSPPDIADFVVAFVALRILKFS